MFENEFKIIAKTSFGLEEILEAELNEIGVQHIEKGTRLVSFTATKEILYKTNLWLRTANRLLVPFRQFQIKNTEDLYQKIKQIPWETIFDVTQTFAIDSTVSSTLFNHTKFPALKAKDAIADRFREIMQERPNVDTNKPHVRINLHIGFDNTCTVSLDSSGDPLFKRGYRDSRSVAPIKEDLAAGMILLSGWDKKSTFIDLFCGSGTLLIEAAMIANNIPPNINRGEFGFFNWKNFDEDLFEKVVNEALAAEIDSPAQIIGVDNNGRVLGMSRANIKAAGLSDKIKLHLKEFNEFVPPNEVGVIVSNPPYGERIGEKVDELYEAFGNNLKEKYANWNAWFISSNFEALKKVGLRSSQKIKLFNGNLECRFMKYEMYRGTKKLHKLQVNNDA